MSPNPESVLDILPGTHLKLEESAAVEEVVGTFIDGAQGGIRTHTSFRESGF